MRYFLSESAEDELITLCCTVGFKIPIVSGPIFPNPPIYSSVQPEPLRKEYSMGLLTEVSVFNVSHELFKVS
uniref:Ovule protein n=1 Tax=Schistosoma curassoni TaxID=6186 RepID=A0A183KY79_9TREM